MQIQHNRSSLGDKNRDNYYLTEYIDFSIFRAYSPPSVLTKKKYLYEPLIKYIQRALHVKPHFFSYHIFSILRKCIC